MFSVKRAGPAKVSASELVSVSLKTLIDLARPAAGLNLKHSAIRAGQSGGYLSRFKGRGMEFEEARGYQPGDDIRSIDWRVTARTGETHTKVFREERERPVFISVDNRPAMHFATRGVFKSVLAAKLAGLLAWAAQHHGDRIGGQLFTEVVCRELKPQNGKHAVLRFLNAITSQEDLNRADPSVITLEHALSRLMHHARPGSLVYIISDFRGVNDQVENHLAKLSRHCEVVLIFVYDSLESHLPEKGRYRFIASDVAGLSGTGAATGDRRDVVIDTGDRQRLLKYHQHFAQRLQQLEQIAKKMGLAFIQCSTTDDPIQRLR
ncbi:DUF58 domain-containing protein [Candidatus Methylobacter oryzae]|uniref:DUF58 domain-containing protein n=1 Tax=Candidatus Methylobacter oryzae TaxID=2497749 RepID=A0ABY3C5M7_9GAMM|nr:DUF58 domain-containing protein [Candidatus Methylobacter oryzae]TRW90323.1 DUF58 domain-containing protein [Candidatus Methylobacter oryzae]